MSITYQNPTDEWQSFAIVGVGRGAPERVRDGGTSTLTATLSAGSYTFWCGDDADKGMRGTLTVTAPGTATDGTTTVGTTTVGTTTAPGAPPAAPSSATISVGDDFFSPTSLTLAAGQVTVTVTNTGKSDHTWTVLGGLANVVIAPGQTKSVTFTASAGTYTFFCAYHSVMRGTLTVVGGTSGGGSGGTTPTGTTTPGTTPTPGTTTTSAPPSAPGTTSVTVSDFAFAPSTLSVDAGNVSLVLHNAGQFPHTFTIDGVVNAALQPGETKTVTLQLAAGTYRFYCAVSGHAGLGMVGTLVAGGSGGTAGASTTMTGMTMTGTTMTGTTDAPGTATHDHSTAAGSGALVHCQTQPAFSASGQLMSAQRTSLTLHVTRATAAGRRYTGKHLALAIRAGATVTRSWSAGAPTLEPGDRLRVSVGRCTEKPRRLVATRIVELGPASTSNPAAKPDLDVVLREFKFEPSKLSAKPGTITLKATNAGKLPHTFTIEGLVDVKVAPGKSRTVTFRAKAGTYAVYCAELGHKSAGMVATLVVG